MKGHEIPESFLATFALESCYLSEGLLADDKGFSLFRDYRFSHSTLHQRDSRSALFEGYNGSGRNSADPARRPSPAPGGYGYGYSGGSSNGSGLGGTHLGVDNRASYRPATPNSRYELIRHIPLPSPRGNTEE